jgi:hypothetical protein
LWKEQDLARYDGTKQLDVMDRKEYREWLIKQ